MRTVFPPFTKLVSVAMVLWSAIALQAQVNIPTNFMVRAVITTNGGSLKGEYWKQPVNSWPTDGMTNPTNRLFNLIPGLGTAQGTFTAKKLVYLGNDLSHVTNWLGTDSTSFTGATNNLDDGVVRFTGFINITNDTSTPLKIGTTSDDGSRIRIGDIDVLNNDNSHGDTTIDTNVVFAAAGVYPIEITYFNGDWTDDGTGALLNHSGNPDPAHHGGANFHLRVDGADITTARAAKLLYSSVGSVVISTNYSVGAALASPGGTLAGEYWKRTPISTPTDGATNPTNRIDELIYTYGSPDGKFVAKKLVYLGTDLSNITNWLSTDAVSFSGNTNNLDDGAVRLRGFISITNAGPLTLGTTSDDGSRITVGGVDVVNNDGSHGDATVDGTVFFTAAGLYPIEITYWNGDWTDDGTGALLNHSGNPDPAHHGGANFHLRVGGADVTAAKAAALFSSNGPAVFIPADLAAAPPKTSGGGSLKGEYWKRGVNSMPVDGATNPSNRVDVVIDSFGAPDGTFVAKKLVYLGNDLTGITNWLSSDFASFAGSTNNLDDGAIRFTGFIDVGLPGTVKLGTTSDDGSRITIGGVDVINNDNSHGDATVDASVVFAAAGLYPIEITYFNGDWTDDGTGAQLNHSGNPDPAHHGGANFHLRVSGADVTAARAAMFFPPAPAAQVASVSINNANGTITITFPGGYRLEHSSALGSTAKWTEASKSSPYAIQPGTAVDFFRAVSP